MRKSLQNNPPTISHANCHEKGAVSAKVFELLSLFGSVHPKVASLAKRAGVQAAICVLTLGCKFCTSFGMVTTPAHIKCVGLVVSVMAVGGKLYLAFGVATAVLFRNRFGSLHIADGEDGLMGASG